ncbi:MAG: hypothetical protein WDO74_29580 [Pseudomonadota bacterium]
MKRAAVTVIFFGAVAALGGCPSETRDAGCYRNADCAAGYECDVYRGECRAPSDDHSDPCNVPADCARSYTCSKNGRCLPGDCYFHDCVTGFECQSSTGKWECLPSSAGAAGAAGSEDTTQAGAGGVVDAAGQGG